VMLGSVAFASEPLPADKLRSAVVRVENGTGFIAKGKSGKTYLVTNWHVAQSSRHRGMLYATRESGELISGRVAKMDAVRDLAAAEVNQPNPLVLAPERVRGEVVYTRGYPYGILTDSAGKIGQDITFPYAYPIAEVGRCPAGSKEIEDTTGRLVACGITWANTLSTVYARPGSSGSPVVNGKGELVGVVESWTPNGTMEAGLVRYEDLKAFLGAL
jgi:S1-C subfamily serine protease